MVGCASLLGWWLADRERALQLVLFTSIPLAFLGGFTLAVEAPCPSRCSGCAGFPPSTAGIEASLRFNQLGAPLWAGLSQLAWLAARHGIADLAGCSLAGGAAVR